MTEDQLLLQEEAIKQLNSYYDTGDVEDDHCQYDKILCNLLIELGFEKVVKEYNKTDKWFA